MTEHRWTRANRRSRQTGTRATVYPWVCEVCGAYAEVDQGQIVLTSQVLMTPGRLELRVWGIDANCEVHAVKAVHEL